MDGYCGYCQHKQHHTHRDLHTRQPTQQQPYAGASGTHKGDNKVQWFVRVFRCGEHKPGWDEKRSVMPAAPSISALYPRHHAFVLPRRFTNYRLAKGFVIFTSSRATALLQASTFHTFVLQIWLSNMLSPWPVQLHELRLCDTLGLLPP